MKLVSALIGISTLTSLISLWMLFTASGSKVAFVITLFGLLVLVFGFGIYFQASRGENTDEDPFEVAVRIYVTVITMFIGFLALVFLHDVPVTYGVSISEIVLLVSLLILLQDWPSANSKIRFTNGQISNLHSIYTASIIMGAFFVLIGMFSGSLSPKVTFSFLSSKFDSPVIFAILIATTVVLSLVSGYMLRDNLVIEQPEIIRE